MEFFACNTHLHSDCKKNALFSPDIGPCVGALVIISPSSLSEKDLHDVFCNIVCVSLRIMAFNVPLRRVFRAVRWLGGAACTRAT